MVKKTEKYHIVNYMEELVNATLRGLLTQMPKNDSLSRREEVDVKALALNRLWPMYVTTERGRRFVQNDIVSDQIDRDVRREVQAAMEIVSRRPRRG